MLDHRRCLLPASHVCFFHVGEDFLEDRRTVKGLDRASPVKDHRHRDVQVVRDGHLFWTSDMDQHKSVLVQRDAKRVKVALEPKVLELFSCLLLHFWGETVRDGQHFQCKGTNPLGDRVQCPGKFDLDRV